MSATGSSTGLGRAPTAMSHLEDIAMRQPLARLRAWPRLAGVAATAVMVLATQLAAGPTPATAAGGSGVAPAAHGELDCNGYSPIQQSIKTTLPCTDPHGSSSGRFYDNGYYIGHDEPNLRFVSGAAGSGNNVTWTQTLPVDPTAPPTTSSPATAVTHFFELSIAPWFSMALCDPRSYPQTSCTPRSDANAPSRNGSYPGGGSAFMELQFYPPGFAPFADSISCNNKYWCGALTLDSLECTQYFHYCNPNCTEPVNFAFLQRNGVPTGAPSPQLASLASFTPNSQTLMMKPGDTIQARIFDAPAPGGGQALMAVVKDLTTHQTGYMQASAANGFMNTNLANCHGYPFNFQPEYQTAAAGNVVPWAALQTDISTTFEIGHFTPCSTLSGPVPSTTMYTSCHGAYESATSSDGTNAPASTSPIEAAHSDGPCFKKGDTHGGAASGGETVAPNVVTGCLNFFNGGDLDFDGTPYYRQDWPTGTTPTANVPSTMQIQPPVTGPQGRQIGYSQVQFEADNGFSDYRCQILTGVGCQVPPPGPGGFYPYWTQTKSCVWEFGNVTSGTTFGGVKQYGQPYPLAIGHIHVYGTDIGPLMSLDSSGCAQPPSS